MNCIVAPFAVMAAVAIIVAGFVAAAIISAPTPAIVWMVAYLVLVSGVAQYLFGKGQAYLAPEPPAMAMVWGQWGLLNVGMACIIGGSLAYVSAAVIVGTVLFDVAVLWLAWGVRHGSEIRWKLAYWLLAAIMLVSSWVGVGLAGSV